MIGDDIRLDIECLFLPIFFFRKIFSAPLKWLLAVKFCKFDPDIFQELIF